MNFEFRFTEHIFLYALLFLPGLWLFFMFFYQRKLKKAQNQIQNKLLNFLTSSASISKKKWKLILQFLTLVLFLLALARPQSGQGSKTVKSEGIEILLLVDVSNSMLAEDIKPSRLEFVKKELYKLLNQSGGDRIGLIAFAGSAVLQAPVTKDKSALKMYIDSLSPESVSSQGTEFRKALLEAKNAFKRGGVEDGDNTVVTRAIIVISDGEDNEPGAVEAAKKLVEEDNIHIFSMGVGTEKGAPIPVRDKFGELKGYRKDKNRQTILTKTKGTILKKLAQVGKGSYYHATFSSEASKSLYKDIEGLEKSNFESTEVKNYDENYQIILLVGILLALIEVSLGDRRAQGRIWQGRFEVNND